MVWIRCVISAVARGMWESFRPVMMVERGGENVVGQGIVFISS